MKRRLLEIVRCPLCRGSLEPHVIPEGASANPGRFAQASDIETGFLRCVRCKLLYPVIGGIPRLIRNAIDEYPVFYDEHRVLAVRLGALDGVTRTLTRVEAVIFDPRSNRSFGHQWAMYGYDDRTWYKDDCELRRSEFLQSMDVRAEDLRGALVLDAGCGNGKLTASIARYGAEVVGMDLSRSVERAAAHAAEVAGERAPFVHFIQGNVMEPPFAEETFDQIHTSGVLHHTPDTWRAFDSFRALVRPGGHAYVQLYRVREPWVGIPNAILRKLTTRLPVRLLWKLCWHGVPLHTALVLLVARLRGERSPIRRASRRERALSLFDHLSPRYQYRYTPEEVRARFVGAGLADVKDVTLANEARHMVAFVGTRPRAPVHASAA